MALLPILEFPDPRLRKVAKPVEEVTDDTRTLIDNMFETMYDAPGIGLAATQVDVHQRIIVIDVSENGDQPQVFINPEIKVLEPELGEYDEGCLSVPGFYETVRRPQRIEVTSLDRNGESTTRELDGLLEVRGAEAPWPAGERRKLAVRLSNESGAVWRAGERLGGGIALEVQLWSDHRNLWADRGWLGLPLDLEPGQSFTFDVEIRRPLAEQVRLCFIPHVLEHTSLEDHGGPSWRREV